MQSHRFGTSLRSLVAGAAVLALPFTAATAAPATAAPATAAPARASLEAPEGGEGIESDVAELAVDESPQALDAPTDADAPFTEAGAPEQDGTVVATSGETTGLAVVGVTWEQGTAPDGATVVLRTRTAKTWSEWAVLDQEEVVSDDRTEDEVGSDATVLRDGTEPAFVGDVDEVEVAVRGAADSLPQDIRLVVIEPGEADAEPTVATTRLVEEPDVAPPAIVDESASGGTTFEPDGFAAAAVSRPTINTRAQWGADESIMTWTPQVGRVNGAVVHHTAGSNNYTAAQVPSIIRGIYTYHAQSRGWGDIGYNFLVDKFGRIWEGRAGGVERAIVGAHASGVNSHTFGLSLMGNYDQVGVPAAAMDAMSRLIAWKLSLHGVSANGTASIDGRTMSAVVGHRDVGQTSCPGANLYPRLGELRSKAASLQGSAPFRTTSRSLAGDALPELVVEQRGTVSLRAPRGWGWEAPTTVSTGWAGRTLVAAGDWDRDGRGDLVWRDASGRLFLLARTANGWAAPRQIGEGWSVMNAIVGGFDWDGNGYPDLLARRASDGGLWLYPNNGRGGFGSPRQIGWGWQSMSAITMIGNLRSGPALVARDATGRLVTYRGDGRGGFNGTVRLGQGWNAMTTLIGVGDASGDGHADLIARDRDGFLWRYPGDGQGSFGARTQIGNGWQSFSAVVGTRSGDVIEVYPVDRSGNLRRYPYSKDDRFGTTLPTSVRVGAGASVVPSGDWNGDGRPDLMVRGSDGRLFLHAGTGDGAFSPTATQIGVGWSGMVSIVGAPNFAGDGRPALLSLERGSGRIWVYPGDGRGGFGRPFVIGTAPGADTLVSVGAWTGRVPDVVTRESGALVLREGNGAGQLGAPRRIGQGWGGAASIIGVGDATRDGRPDIALVAADGTVRLYPGDGRGGFLASYPFGSVPQGAATS
ncbi:FG-GAP-like repeat-containing protein [Cellulosimicrobium sp. TH-20]|uniref:FG-GAP-like repeat-containing protein n=1 Tax=Cellulosimicrobium sp. TH-20 TaxID=1980001 RepID=UPI0012F8471C|nr:FG-GAP-like repeat-containing protein [Cellulosimicrobium sp. TH-20]